MIGDAEFESRLWRIASRFWLGVVVVSIGFAVGIVAAGAAIRPRKNLS